MCPHAAATFSYASVHGPRPSFVVFQLPKGCMAAWPGSCCKNGSTARLRMRSRIRSKRSDRLLDQRTGRANAPNQSYLTTTLHHSDDGRAASSSLHHHPKSITFPSLCVDLRAAEMQDVRRVATRSPWRRCMACGAQSQ